MIERTQDQRRADAERFARSVIFDTWKQEVPKETMDFVVSKLLKALPDAALKEG